MAYNYFIMPISKKIINLLEKNRVEYELIGHKTVYTAFDKAQTLKMKPGMIGKTLVLKTDSDLAVVLVPANKNLDKNKFKKTINNWLRKNGQNSVKSIGFVTERLMKNRFKGVKIGAVPPFGNLFGFPSFVNKSLLNQPNIIINSGDYARSIKIKGAFLKRLIPEIITGSFVKPRK